MSVSRRCKLHKKITHYTLGAATKACLYASKISGRPYRYYLASCGNYHVTHINQEQYDKRVRFYGNRTS